MKQLHNVPDAELVGGDLFQRLFELGVRLADTMDRGLAERGLTRARAELLWRLRRHGPQAQRALSVLLECTTRNVTGLVDALEAGGYVQRRPHPTDRRATLVDLTPRGTDAARRMEREASAASRDLFVGIEPSELAAFSATLDRVLVRMGATPENETRPA